MEALLLVLQGILLAQFAVGEPTLQLASVVFRHGDRSPEQVFPTDPNKEDTWPQGFGQLSLTGMRQEYFLGELLRNRYVTESGFLFENYTRAQVSVRSTDYDRTLMSAASLLAGQFPPDEEQEFNSSIPWQPVPVHTVPKDEDNLLKAYNINCPKYSQLMEEDKNTKAYKDKMKENEEFFKELEKYTGQVPVDLSNIWRIYGTLYIESVSNRTLPSWATPEYMERMANLSAFTLELLFNSKEKNRLTAGLWIQKVLTDMKGKASGNKSFTDSKLFLYSAHDATVASMMIALQVYDGVRPPYASAFFVELLSNDTGYYVELSYRYDTDSDDIEKLNVSYCAQPSRCTLSEFEKFAVSLIPDNWEKECGLETASSNKKAIIILSTLLAAFVLACIVLSVIIILLCKRVCNKKAQYTEINGRETV